VKDRKLPHDDRAPVVADEDRGPLAERVQEATHVLAQRNDVVVLDCCRQGAEAVPAHVRCEHVIAGRDKRRHLPAPRERQLGKAVT